MSRYEQKRWEELRAHWEKKAKQRRQLLPPRAKAALETTVQATKDTATKAGRAVADATPEKVKDIAGPAVDAALVPTVQGVVHVLELVNDWVVELTDQEAVFEHHRGKGRDVSSLEDLRALDLQLLDEFTHGMVLRWRTLGAGQGASFGALAMIPVPVVGSLAAITLDMVAMQALSGAIATRVCYAYGFDAADPAMRHMIDRMVVRAYRNQAPKAGTVKSAARAFDAAKGRVNWSQKLRDDHRLMAAVEKLMKRLGDGSRVPVKNARMGMPLIAIFAGAGTNAHVLGDIAKQARHYGSTMLLAEKYGLELPPNLRQDLDNAESPDAPTTDGGLSGFTTD
ncbi:EcsC family protein [Blastococcus saxobsidens]|uniref:EcsC family protein n=2 Tax=Blastococcus saxobsidens TaxID=138336 RepID=A0A4Q7Y3C2_9ACTN|nr:EcsC family protein [Blastococcus saxobsidens]